MQSLRKEEKEMAKDKITVVITNRQKNVQIPTGLRMLVRRCCTATLKTEGFKGSAEVSVSFVNNAQIRELNAQYRNKDIETDVLSFGLRPRGQFRAYSYA